VTRGPDQVRALATNPLKLMSALPTENLHEQVLKFREV